MLTLLIDEPGAFDLPIGERCVLDEHGAGLYLLQGWGRAARGLPVGLPKIWTKGWTKDGVLVFRPGGLGDLICLRPVLEVLLAQGHAVTVCAHEAHWVALQGLPVDLLAYPPRAAEVEAFRVVMDLDGVIEREPPGGRDAVACLAAACGVSDAGLVPRMVRFPVPSSRLAVHGLQFPASGSRKRLGVVLHASALMRTWPLERIGELIREALSQDWDVVLLGKPGPWPQIDTPGVELAEGRVWMLPRSDLSLEDSLGVLAACDVVVSPDTGLLHAAGAMGVPAAGLFGPFEAAQRVARYASVRAIEGRAPCAPCGHHPRTAEQTWPSGKPCAVECHCVALAGITGKRVMEVVNDTLTHSYPTALWRFLAPVNKY